MGIIGCSSIAQRIMIPTLNEMKNLEIQSISSRSSKKAKQVAKKWSIKNYGNYDDIIDDKNVDSVYISLPIALQEKWIKKAAKSGKNILCEKSAVTSFKQAKEVIKECKNNNVTILEVFSYKFHPQHKKIKNLIKNNSIGKVKYFIGKYGFPLKVSKSNFRWNKKLGGGVLNDVGCYIINSSMIYLGKPISVVCNLKENNSGLDIMGNLSMEYKDNSSSIGMFSYETSFQSTYSIWGTKGILTSKRAYNVKKSTNTEISINVNDKEKNLKVKPYNHIENMINNFIIQNSRNQIKNYEEFLLQAKIMEAARQSHQKNKSIQLDSIK